MKYLHFLKIDWILPRILIITFSFYFLKTAFWPLTYLFVAGFGIGVLLLFLRFDPDLRLSQFFAEFKLPAILAGVIILIYLLWHQFSIAIVRKDLLLIILLFTQFYFLFWKKSILKDKKLLTFFLKLFVITIFVISLLNLFFLMFRIDIPLTHLARFNISSRFTVANDYNFFSLFLLLGLVIINNKNKESPLYLRLPFKTSLLLSLILILNIGLSGSKRAILVLFILIAAKIIYFLFTGIRRRKISEILKTAITFVLISTLFLFFCFITLRFIPKLSLMDLESRYSKLIGLDNLRFAEKLIWKGEPEIPLEGSKLIDNKSFDVKEKYWKCVFAPGTSVNWSDSFFGKSIQVTRAGGKNNGFSLQYVGPVILYYANHTYKISFKIKFIKGDFSTFNIGWWVNDGNKGFENTAALEKETEQLGEGWYKCTSEYTFIDNHFGIEGFFNSVGNETSFIVSDFELADLNYNQKLPRFEFEVGGGRNLNLWMAKNNPPFSGQNLLNNGNFESGLAFWKFTSKAAIDIKIENVDGHNCALVSRGIGNGGDWSLFYTGRPIQYKANNKYQIAFRFKPVKPKSIPFKVGFWVEEGEGNKYNLGLRIDTLTDGWFDVKASYTFKNNQYNLMFPINSQTDNSQFYVTDLSLVNLTQLQAQTIPVPSSDDLIKSGIGFSDRTSRWVFATKLWETDYKWYNKLFGHGFDYLNRYGEKFNKNSPDWPHNPFLSVLLYSGIIGLPIYIYLLIKAVILYLKYKKQYEIAFVGFLITFFFSFFSGSSPFDPPIMGFFIILPFYIQSMHNKSKESSNK